MIEAIIDHLGIERGERYLRKVYPWYLGMLGADKETQALVQQADGLKQARAILRASIA
jgi:hypothetical protein